MVRWLLRLYPASFRHAHGRELEALIARERRDVRTPWRIVPFWLRIVFDACVSAAAAHCDILKHDVRDAWRAYRRAPGFAVTVLVLVALGIGATTAAFSLADVVLLRPLPFPDADRLVKVWERRPGFSQMELSPANYRDWKGMATSFETFSAYRGLSATLIRSGRPSRIDGTVVTADLLRTLGATPRLGRAFTEADDREGAPATVLLSHGLWEREFGADPSVVGTTIRLNDEIHTIVGVMPRDFHFPRRSTQLWVPMRLAAEALVDRNDNYLDVVARVRSDVPIEQARTEMSWLAERLKQAYPTENEHTGANVTALRDEAGQQARLMLLALAGASACVLLLACSNLANLLVARAIARRREMALRLALGAGRERLVRQVLTETLLLTGLGGVVGVTLAAGALPALSRLVPSALPITDVPAIDARVLGFAVLATLVTGLSVSLVPLLRHARDRVGEGLREGARAIGAGSERARGALVVTQLAASVVLLVMCGLLLRALWTIRVVDPGFTTTGVLTARTSLPMPKYENTESRTRFYARVLSDVRAVPGVTHAAYISFLPLGDMRGGIFPVGVGAVVEDRRDNNVALLRYATPGYFEAMRIPLREGRDLAQTDTSETQPVAVVSRRADGPRRDGARSRHDRHRQPRTRRQGRARRPRIRPSLGVVPICAPSRAAELSSARLRDSMAAARSVRGQGVAMTPVIRLLRAAGTAALTLVLVAVPAVAQTGGDGSQGTPATKDRYLVAYQINSGDDAHIAAALKNIGNALTDPRLKGKLQVRLVVHGSGVKTLRKDGGFESTLRALADEGVALLQCERTLAERKIPKTDMLPFISYVPSANGELIILQQQGWAIMHP